jgi:aspartate ammonia-lyase
MQKFRIERDTMGEMSVPAEARYGAGTMRAVINFPISQLRLPPVFIHTLGLSKRAASTGESILAVALRLTKLREAELRRILNPQRMLEPTSEGSEIDVRTSENPA